MPLMLTDDQTMLQETAAQFLAEEGVDRQAAAALRDTGCTDGFGTDLWKQFGELGLAGICIPEAHGGLGLGAVEAALVLEEIGRNLTPSPVPHDRGRRRRARSKARRRRERWFPRHPVGRDRACAGNRRRPKPRARDRPLMRAETAGQRLRAQRRQAVRRSRRCGGRRADRRSHGRIAGRDRWPDACSPSPKGTAGVDVENVTLADSSKAARLSFDNVALDADAVVGEVDGGWAPLSRALNAGRAGAAAELVGVAAGASAMTLDYLKQRKQFGKLIGEFQALQHRAAHLYGEIEIARAAAFKAARIARCRRRRAPN